MNEQQGLGHDRAGVLDRIQQLAGALATGVCIEVDQMCYNLLSRAIEINPGIEYKKFNGLAKIYIKEGKYKEAEKLLRQSIANYPYDSEARELLSDIRDKL